MLNRKWLMMALIAGLMMGCSKPEPAPAPPPQVANPAPAPVGPGTCPPLPAGGVPLRTDNQPFTGSLYGSNNSTGSMSVSLFATNSNFGDPVINILGTGTMNLPDLSAMLGGYSAAQSFCVSSVDPSANNAVNPGTLTSSYGGNYGNPVSIQLTGFIQVPTYSPFQGYPGSNPSYPGGTPTPPTAPTRVNVGIGTYRGCPAAIRSTQFAPGSCVVVSIGQGPSAQVLQYQINVGAAMGGGYSGSSGIGFGY